SGHPIGPFHPRGGSSWRASTGRVRIVGVSTPEFEFDAATAVELLGDTTCAGRVDAGWTVGDKPNGGYLLGMIARAAGAVLEAAGSPHRDPLAATAHYLRAPDVGDVTLRSEVLRVGRGASQIRTVLEQDGQA